MEHVYNNSPKTATDNNFSQTRGRPGFTSR